jgi:hypothetical protein
MTVPIEVYGLLAIVVITFLISGSLIIWAYYKDRNKH